MPSDRINRILDARVKEIEKNQSRKGVETVFESVIFPGNGRGPRFRLRGAGDQEFLRMNSNSYLGMSFQEKVVAGEERTVRSVGAGPGAVRFISGTWSAHVDLEKALATFHRREAAMLFSSAYATVMGVVPMLTTDETIIISDALNHNCIINAVALGKPKIKSIYPHLDLDALADALRSGSQSCKRAIIVTDGIFSMRGDHAPLRDIMALAGEYDALYPENVVVIVDDSHGVGAFGNNGRGTEEYTASPPVDVLIGTLGKAFGVNGGYVTGASVFIDYLREVSPFYIYSNPITPGEAAAAAAAIAVVDSDEGRALLSALRKNTRDFEAGLQRLGFETIVSAHPVVPLMVRDTARTRALVAHLKAHGVLATGLNYPVVPKGDEEIRFQLSADHTTADIDEVLDVLSRFREA